MENYNSMTVPTNPSPDDVKALNGIIGWFHQSSSELTQEYRRLEDRVAKLNGELEKKNQELERSLRDREEARAYLLSVLESFKAGVLVLDPGLRPILANRGLTELVGEIDETGLAHVLGDKLLSYLRRQENEFLPLECERVVSGPDGQTTPIHLTISQVAVGCHRNDYVLVLQDIGRVKRLEAEAARTRRLTALGVMAAELAHQIKNPLGGIELFASLLKEKSTGETQRLAGEIMSATQRLSATISHLLAFAADPTLASEVLPVSDLLRDLEDITEPLFHQKKWTLNIATEPNLPPLWGDRGLLAQALLNLVVNATEAMPEGGAVTILAHLSPFSTMNGRVHRAVELKVADEGVGIPQENREKIFDPFYTTKSDGTGLGLALTHKIVDAHGGSIAISSAAGRGTEFTLFLPAAEGLEEYAETNCHSG